MTFAGGTGNRLAQITALGVGLGGTNPSNSGPIVNGVLSPISSVSQSALAVVANLLGPAPTWMNHGAASGNNIPVSFCNIYNTMFNYDASYRI